MKSQAKIRIAADIGGTFTDVAAFDEKRGAVCNALSLTDAPFLNHRVEWTGGVMAEECSMILKDFFRARR